VSTPLLLIVLLAALLAGGVWIAVTLGIVAWTGVAFFSSTRPEINLVTSYWNTYSSLSLASLPMFIWMGEILFRTRLAEQMFAGLAPWLGRIPGRLLHVNVLGCGLFGAVCGSSAVTCATIGKISLPELKRRGYPEPIALGSLCGSGTLGILIPPSIAMIVYAVASDVSIIRMFIAGVLPGVLVLVLFSGYIAFWAWRHPEQIPVERDERSFGERLRATGSLIPVLLLIVLVFLSMVTGVATAIEASAFGVLGALVIAAWGRSLTWANLRASLAGTLRLSGMIMFILGASAFLTVAMGFTGIPKAASEWVAGLGLSPYVLIMILTLVYLIMGCFLDGVSMIVLTTAVVLPIVVKAGFDPIWFGIYIIFMIELAQVTPPVGFNLFVLQGMSGRPIFTVAKASIPFALLLLLGTALIVVFPSIATWLPKALMG
jgi:tripartite ATP-independent transporter DctM subunit